MALEYIEMALHTHPHTYYLKLIKTRCSKLPGFKYRLEKKSWDLKQRVNQYYNKHDKRHKIVHDISI